jgi:hypothetical protein
MEDESPRDTPAEPSEAAPETAPDALGATSNAPFSPAFFLGQLRAFARECCPSHLEPLPSVSLHLATGEVLGLCHVMGLAPSFVALAVHDEARGGGATSMAMRTELVPYALITRGDARGGRVGSAPGGRGQRAAPRPGAGVIRHPSVALWRIGRVRRADARNPTALPLAEAARGASGAQGGGYEA